MQWTALTLISIVSISVANLFQRLAMKNKGTDPITSSITFQFLIGIITATFAITQGFNLPPLRLIFPFFTISAVLYAVGTLLIFRAIKNIEASELAILVGSSSVATLITAFLFLGERLTLLQFAGALLILAAVVVAQYRSGGVNFNKWVLFGLIGNIFYGLAVTNDAYILKTYDAISYTPIMSFLPGVVLCVLYPSATKKLVLNLKNSVDGNLVIYSFFYAIQAVTYYLALQFGALASQISVIFKSEIILTILLATLFLGERKYLLKKLFAAVLVTVGAIMLA